MRSCTTHTPLAPLLAGLVILAVAVPAGGGVLTLTPSDLGAIQNPQVSNDARFLLGFELPEGLRKGDVDLAVLEFVAAVTCPDSASTLTLDAFALISEWDGQTVEWYQGWDAPGGDFDRELHAVWSVAPSDTARIRLDVTDMISTCLSAERRSCSLIVAVARGETGEFAPLCLGDGAEEVPELTIWYTSLGLERANRGGMGPR